MRDRSSVRKMTRGPEAGSCICTIQLARRASSCCDSFARTLKKSDAIRSTYIVTQKSKLFFILRRCHWKELGCGAWSNILDLGDLSWLALSMSYTQDRDGDILDAMTDDGAVDRTAEKHWPLCYKSGLNAKQLELWASRSALLASRCTWKRWFLIAYVRLVNQCKAIGSSPFCQDS